MKVQDRSPSGLSIPSDEILAIREFFEWVASEIAECDLTPEETRVGLDLIAYRRGVDPEALKARLEDARRKMDAEDLLSLGGEALHVA
jgi:hypothetical protein